MICIKTVKNFCNGDITKIENYEKAINNIQTWDCHHRKETDEGLSRKQLKELGLYYDRPSNELIFLTKSEHRSLHHKDKPKSEEQKQKQSELMKGKPKSEEHKQKISESMKGKPKSEETRQRISESKKGFIPFNTGKHRVYDENGKFHYEI